MVYTPEEEKKWAEGGVRFMGGKFYRLSYKIILSGDIIQLFWKIREIIGVDKMDELLGVPKELFHSFGYDSEHECFRIGKAQPINIRELIDIIPSLSDEERSRLQGEIEEEEIERFYEDWQKEEEEEHEKEEEES